MLAGDADRERAVGVLKDAFTEGRLTKPEYEDRVGRVYQARTYADLDAVTSDIPVPMAPLRPLPYNVVPTVPLYVPLAVRPTNGTATASLVCGVVGFVTCGLTSIPAVVLGHVAKKAVARTGEDGDGFATAGLVLGYFAVVVWAVLIVVGFTTS